MFREWFQGAGSTGWPLIALLVFFGVFMLVLSYVRFAMKDRESLDRMAAMPLDEGNPATPSDGGISE